MDVKNNLKFLPNPVKKIIFRYDSASWLFDLNPFANHQIRIPALPAGFFEFSEKAPRQIKPIHGVPRNIRFRQFDGTRVFDFPSVRDPPH